MTSPCFPVRGGRTLPSLRIATRTPLALCANPRYLNGIGRTGGGCGACGCTKVVTGGGVLLTGGGGGAGFGRKLNGSRFGVSNVSAPGFNRSRLTSATCIVSGWRCVASRGLDGAAALSAVSKGEN